MRSKGENTLMISQISKILGKMSWIVLGRKEREVRRKKFPILVMKEEGLKVSMKMECGKSNGFDGIPVEFSVRNSGVFISFESQ